jgi:signal transduction histidine kinase
VPLPTDVSKSSQQAKYAIQIVVLALLYVATGWIGLSLDQYSEHESLIWPPSGLALAALILYGRRLWPGVLLGSITLNVIVGGDHSAGLAVAIPTGLAVAVGNMLEALVGSWLMVEYFGFRPTLARIRDVVVLLVVGGVFATAISTAIGTTSLWLAGDFASGDVIPFMLVWWLGALGAVVTLTPVLLLLRTGTPARPALIRNPEFWGVVSLLAITCLLAFGDFASIDAKRLAIQLPLPCLVWAGIRLGTRGAVIVSFLTIAAAAMATSQGLGPLAATEAPVSMILLWTYGIGLGSTALTLAAAIAQRDSAENQHRLEVAERERGERERLLSDERERIMREMHDGLGGQLISLLSMVQLGKASHDEVAEGLRRSLDDMRIVIDSLEERASSFRELLGKLRARLDPLLRRNEISLQWRVDDLPALDELGPEEALHCVRIIQEAVSNVIQHAWAHRVEIDISSEEEDPRSIVIGIRDDGIGSTPGTTSAGRGTRNMADRAHAIGATLSIEPAEPGRRIRLSIPVDQRSLDAAEEPS